MDNPINHSEHLFYAGLSIKKICLRFDRRFEGVNTSYMPLYQRFPTGVYAEKGWRVTKRTRRILSEVRRLSLKSEPCIQPNPTRGDKPILFVSSFLFLRFPFCSHFLFVSFYSLPSLSLNVNYFISLFFILLIFLLYFFFLYLYHRLYRLFISFHRVGYLVRRPIVDPARHATFLR